MNNYFIEKNKDTKEIIYIEYNNSNGYQINPKIKKEDAIEVNKIVFISPTLTEKLIKKKIDHALNKLLEEMKTIEDDDTDDGTIRKSLMEAERLKLNIINTYTKYLGNTYRSLTLKKIQIMINQLRYKLYIIRDNEQEKLMSYNNNLNDNQKRGR